MHNIARGIVLPLTIIITATFVFGRATLADNSISIAFNSDWPPYSFGSGDSVDGILPRLAKAILEENMGVKTTVIGLPWKRVQRGVEKGAYDAMITVPTNRRLDYARSSGETVFILDMRPIVRKGADIPDLLPRERTAGALKSLRVCDILGNGWAENFYRNLNVGYETASTVESCLRMISGGRADILVQPTDVAARQIAKSGLDGTLEILPHALESMKFTLLISKLSKHGDEFIERFDQLLARLREDGRFSRILSRVSAAN